MLRVGVCTSHKCDARGLRYAGTTAVPTRLKGGMEKRYNEKALKERYRGRDRTRRRDSFHILLLFFGAGGRPR